MSLGSALALLLVMLNDKTLSTGERSRYIFYPLGESKYVATHFGPEKVV